MKDLLEYINSLTDNQVAAVATLDDGRVFTFNRGKLRDLLDKMEASEKFVIFVKSSEKAMEKGGQN